MKNIKEKEMPLLGRKRITIEFESAGQPTPAKSFVKEEIAKKYNTKPELVAIRHVYTNFGNSKAKVIAHIYNDENTLKFLEPEKGKKKKVAAG